MSPNTTLRCLPHHRFYKYFTQADLQKISSFLEALLTSFTLQQTYWEHNVFLSNPGPKTCQTANTVLHKVTCNGYKALINAKTPEQKPTQMATETYTSAFPPNPITQEQPRDTHMTRVTCLLTFTASQTFQDVLCSTPCLNSYWSNPRLSTPRTDLIISSFFMSPHTPNCSQNVKSFKICNLRASRGCSFLVLFK